MANITGKRTGLKCMTLKEFISIYQDELEGYYGGEWCCNGNTEMSITVLCLVDMSDILFSTKKKPTLRRGGVERRRKIKHRYSYENPMNRIHGYMFLEDIDNTLIPEDKDFLSLTLVCSSIFSDKRGIGSDLMDILLSHSKEKGFTDVVLEVSNEYTGELYEEEGDEEEYEDEEEYDEEEGYDEEEEGLCEYVLEMLSHELWRKSMRKNEENIPYYNVEETYINKYLTQYFYPEEEEKEEKEPITVSEDEPGDCEYGGFWYKKGYKSQEGLINFYKKFGFCDEPKVHLDWNCYSEDPFPTMICSL